MSGVGDEIAKQIPSWAAKQNRGCGCNDRRKRWNAWGVEACTKRKAAIVSALLAQKDNLNPPLNALPRAALKLAAEKIVDNAIKRATQ